MAASSFPSFGSDASNTLRPYGDSRPNLTYGVESPLPQEAINYRAALPNTESVRRNNNILPDFSPAAVAAGIPPLPIYGDFDTPPYQYPPAPLSHDNMLSAPESYLHRNTLNNLQLAISVASRPSFPQETLVQATEEGELSEGEFDEQDLDTNMRSSGYGEAAQRVVETRSLNVAKYPGRSEPFHGPSPRETQPLTDMYGRALDLNRQRSESYSPRPSPDYLDHQSQRPRVNDGHHHRSQRQQTGRPRPSAVSVARRTSLTEPDPTYEAAPSAEYALPRDRPGSNSPHNHNHRVARGGTENTRFKSVLEARKEAQNAILNLYPLKVRYQDFLDEGIDEDVVRRQFESLGMLPVAEQTGTAKPRDSAGPGGGIKAVNSTTMVRQQRQSSDRSPDQITRDHRDRAVLDAIQPTKSTTSTTTTTMASNKTPANDNMATIMALREKLEKQRALAAKGPSPTNSPASDAPLASTTAIKGQQSAAQAAAKAEKERLLQQKMEALQKSREQRAQKAAAKIPPTSKPTADAADATHTKTPVEPLASKPVVASVAKSTSPIIDLNVQPSRPAIPGLFLAGAPTTMAPTATASSITAEPVTQPNSTDPPQPVTSRKRPVAADFVDSSSSGTSFKRPFGQSRNDQPFIIDVSDESDGEGEVDMDLDEPSSSTNPTFQFRNDRATPSTKSIRDLPPLSDFPARKLFTAPSSGLSTPPIQHGSKSLSKPEHLLRKELEIQEMKKKIAEAERRKKAKQTTSGMSTPLPIRTTDSPARTISGISAQRIETSLEIERLIGDTSRQVDEDVNKLVEARAAEQQTSEAVKQTEAELRHLRRAKLAADLPLVDAKVEQDQKRLAEIREELARIEASVQKGIEEKRQLAEELDRLNREADEQLDAQKTKLRELEREEIRPTPVPDQAEYPSSNQASLSPPLQETVSVVNNSSSASDGEASATPVVDLTANVVTTSSEHALQENDPTMHHSTVAPTALTSDHPHVQSMRSSSEQSEANSESMMDISQTPNDQSPAESSSGASTTGVDVEMADAPSEGQLSSAPVSESSESHSESAEDAEDEYSPEEPGEVADHASDTYEPPEATPLDTNSPSPISSPFSPEPVEVEASEPSRAPSPDAALVQAAADPVQSSPAPESALQAVPVSVPSPLPQTAPADPVVQPQPAQSPQVQAQPTDKQDSTATASASASAPQLRHFTPYETPLKMFRAYRFHPEFTREVGGGFKSITYSNKIRPEKEFCRYELAGGVCNDSTCDFQHFRDVGLADDAILVELGNTSGYNEEDKKRFVAGLRLLLQDLRTKKTKEFAIIAEAIARYRTTFRGEKDKDSLLGLSEGRN